MVENSVKKAVSSAFPACEGKVVYTSKLAFQGRMKDNIPTHSQADVHQLMVQNYLLQALHKPYGLKITTLDISESYQTKDKLILPMFY